MYLPQAKRSSSHAKGATLLKAPRGPILEPEGRSSSHAGGVTLLKAPSGPILKPRRGGLFLNVHLAGIHDNGGIILPPVLDLFLHRRERRVDE